MGKKQTAVEFLIKAFQGAYGDKVINVVSVQVQEAKAMEKEQMDKVSEDWFVEGLMHIKDNKRIYQSFEEYYNKIYKK